MIKIPTYLRQMDYRFDDIALRCYFESEPADKSTGTLASAYLVHAFVGDTDTDISEIMSESAIEIIEDEAAHYFSQ